MIPKIISKECKFALALRSEMGRETSGRYCGKIVQAGKALLTGGLSIVLPRGSDLTTPLSNATLQLHQDKSIPTLAQYFSRGDVCSVSTSSSLSLGRLYIFFIMAYGACFLIFLEMILDPQTAQPEVVEKSREQMENDSDIVSWSSIPLQIFETTQRLSLSCKTAFYWNRRYRKSYRSKTCPCAFVICPTHMSLVEKISIKRLLPWNMQHWRLDYRLFMDWLELGDHMWNVHTP